MRRFPWSLIFLPILIAFASQGQGSSSTADYLNRSTASRTNALQGEKDVRELVLGNPIERELAGDQVHDYQLKLSSGQYLYVAVDQRGIDVLVTLFGPDANKLLEVDSPNGTNGPEPIQWVADASGTYRLEVRALEKDIAPGRYEIAVKELRTATAGDHSRVDALKIFAEGTQLREKDLDQAIAAFTKAIELNPEYGGFYEARGFARMNKADLDGAIADFSKAIELSPNDARVLAQKPFAEGMQLREKNDFDSAIAAFSKVVELNPKFAEAYEERGITRFVGKADFDGAIVDFTKAIGLNPQYARAYGYRGMMELYQGKDKQADADFKKCFALDPKLKSEFESVKKKIKKENRKFAAKH